MDFNKNYAYKIVLSLVIGMVFIVLFMYASPNIPTQWEVNPKEYMKYSLRTLMSNLNDTLQMNKTLLVGTSNISSSDHEEPKTCLKNSSSIKLSDYLFDFPWKKFQASMKSPKENIYRQKLIDGLQEFAFMEPLFPINQSCKAPPLLEEKDINCLKYKNAFLPEKN